MSFEEAALEYSRVVNEYQAKSQLGNLLGNSLNVPTNDEDTYDGGPQGAENKFPRETLEFLMRKAEPYASHAAVGGSFNISNYNFCFPKLCFNDNNDLAHHCKKKTTESLFVFLRLRKNIFCPKRG